MNQTDMLADTTARGLLAAQRGNERRWARSGRW
jgi:hypothetical protein